MTDRAELMDDLRQFFTYTDEEQQDIVDKTIAALEAEEPIGFVVDTDMNRDLNSLRHDDFTNAAWVKPERTVGNIQDFKEMLRNQENDSSSLRITLGDFKQIAKALMAIEPKCKTCKDTHTVLKGIKVIECGCGGSIRACSLCKGYGVYQQDTIADCPDCALHEPAKPSTVDYGNADGFILAEPAKPLPECPECFGKGAITMSDGVSSHPCALCEDKPLPESDQEWLQAVTVPERICPECDIVYEHVQSIDVIDRLKELHSQHQAELAAKDAEIASREAERNEIGNIVDKLYMLLAYRESAREEAARQAEPAQEDK